MNFSEDPVFNNSPVSMIVVNIGKNILKFNFKEYFSIEK